ncbi:MAG: YbaK/EbsC family protein [Actinobacteria bacterium]|nr:YbaK/EbsC family protein [Actinomycetota bacterium]
MAVAGRVKKYLDDQGLAYEVVSHQETFSTCEEAKAVGVIASHVAKTLVIKTHAGDVLAVLPASERVDIHKLRDIADDNHARLATEEEMKMEFTDFDLGAVPPLGELFEAPVLLDGQLENADEIIFAAGTHSDSVKMSGEDFLKLTHPQVVDIVLEEGEGGVY